MATDTPPKRKPGTHQGHPGVRNWSWGAKLLMVATMILTGFLFGIAADQSKTETFTLGLELPRLVEQRQDEIELQEEELTQLREQTAALINADLETADSATTVPMGLQTVSGPGMVVELFDAPADVLTGGEVSANDLVVHQQDVDAVMNALWMGGAEAMSIQGIRISSSTPVRCIGNVILVGGSSFAPPYRIEAIGDPQSLSDAIDADPQIQIYRQYVDAYGIGWRTEIVNELTLAPLSEGYSLRHAELYGGNR